MNEEQLNLAAAEHCKAMNEIPAVNSYHAFKAGARWHESLPLAERLSESEKEKIRILLDDLENGSFWEYDTQLVFLENIKKSFSEIFGSNLFTPTEQ